MLLFCLDWRKHFPEHLERERTVYLSHEGLDDGNAPTCGFSWYLAKRSCCCCCCLHSMLVSARSRVKIAVYVFRFITHALTDSEKSNRYSDTYVEIVADFLEEQIMLTFLLFHFFFASYWGNTWLSWKLFLMIGDIGNRTSILGCN